MNKLFPSPITNNYVGSRIPLFVFGVIVVVTLARSTAHILLPDGGAQTIAGIPLDTYSAAAQAAVILMFSLWGVSQLLMGFVYVAVLIRYRSLIPLMYVLIALEYALRIVVGQLKPIQTLHTAPGEIGNYILVPLALIMLWISLRSTSKSN